MSELFNPMPESLARRLAGRAAGPRPVAEQLAIDALIGGLAFEDVDRDLVQPESPALDQDLQALAAMEKR